MMILLLFDRFILELKGIQFLKAASSVDIVWEEGWGCWDSRLDFTSLENWDILEGPENTLILMFELHKLCGFFSLKFLLKCAKKCFVSGFNNFDNGLVSLLFFMFKYFWLDDVAIIAFWCCNSLL